MPDDSFTPDCQGMLQVSYASSLQQFAVCHMILPQDSHYVLQTSVTKYVEMRFVFSVALHLSFFCADLFVCILCIFVSYCICVVLL